MTVCSKCKQNAHFIVKDSLQICSRCGATTIVAKLQTEDFKGIKIQKHYISEKRVKKVIENKSAYKHIEENWGLYLEAFQRALRESVRIVKLKLNLDDAFDEKAKYYWFEYLKVFRENNIPLIGFFTIPRQGNNQGNQEQNVGGVNINTASQSQTDNQAHLIKNKLYESKYKKRKSILSKTEQDQIEEEYSEEDSQDLYDQNFVEKILKQQSTQDQQKKILEENDDINEIFRYFGDAQRTNFELNNQQEVDPFNQSLFGQNLIGDKLDHQRQKINSVGQNDLGQNKDQQMNGLFNDPVLELLGKGKKNQDNRLNKNYMKTAQFDKVAKNTMQLKQQQQMKNELQGVMNNEMQQYQLQQKQQEQLEQKKKKRRRMKGKLNYIENMDESSKNYFILVLERSEDYVKSLYNGFRSAYLHMLYLQEREVNPLKRIKKLKDSSKGFSISKQFILKQIKNRNISFLKQYDKIDIFHLIWAWDWAEFISSQSTIQFTLKEDVSLLYDYLDRMFQIICKQLIEHQNIESELNKCKQQLQRTKKLNEIKKKLINKSREIKGRSKKGYLSGEDEDDDEDQGDIQEVMNKLKYQTAPRTQKPRIQSPADFVMESFDLNSLKNNNNQTPKENGLDTSMQQQTQKKIPQNQIKSNQQDDNFNQEKIVEELQFQFERFQSRRVINLDDEQLLTLQVIVEEILKEREKTCSQQHKAVNPLFDDEDKLDENQKNKNFKKDDKIISLEYNIIPTIIYISLYSIGETYSPQDINLWMKNGLFPYNLGIAPYIKIADARLYWLYPQSIPSSTFIRSQSKKFLLMTNHVINVSKKRIFLQSLRIISDFGLPLEWACMIYFICVRLYRDKYDKELQSSDEFDCDLIVSAALIIVLKMIYGLNDEMFGVLLNKDVLEETKEYLNEKQYSCLQSIIKYFENNQYRRTSHFYQTVPTFQHVSKSISKFISEQKSEQILDLSDYKQMANLSYSNLIIVLQSFIDKHKLSKVNQKMKNTALSQNQQSQLSSQLMQGNKSAIKSQKLSQQAAQLQYDDLEDEILFMKQMRTHLPKANFNYLSPKTPKRFNNIDNYTFSSVFIEHSQSTQVDQSNIQMKDMSVGSFSIDKSFNYTQKYSKDSKKQSGSLESDIDYISAQAIIKGKSQLPPCYEYEIERNYVANSKTLPNELKFIVDKLSIYTGEDSNKILQYLDKIERKLYNLVTKNTKKNTSSGTTFLSLISQSLSKNKQ